MNARIGSHALAAALIGALLLLATACTPSDVPPGDTGGAGAVDASAEGGDPAARAEAIATEYVQAYYEQFPEDAYETGAPAPMDRFGDRSLEALARWEAREDGWIEALRALDRDALAGTAAAVTWDFALQRLEAARARRVCRMELWNVSPTWTGWQYYLPANFAQAPVGAPAERADLLARARDVPRYLDTEVANLREGVRVGYTAARSNVDAVVGQLDALLEVPVEDSPFLAPAEGAGDEAFTSELRSVVEHEIRPAIRRHRDYLADEYRESAREVVGVSANPDGEACYRASVMYHASLDVSAPEIHELGLQEMDRIQGEMQQIARRTFGTDDVKAVLERVRTDPAYTFDSEAAVLDYAKAAVARGEAAVPDWFGTVPEAELEVRAYPAWQRRSGGGFYSAGSTDGSRPALYQLGTYQPETISRAGMESTAFHESWPGHHLQVSIALEREGLNPAMRYFYVPGMAEGWGLYSEKLADEMGLYSGDVDRLGMLSNQALRAARLVVDPGMHALGWTRQQAVDYMRENTAESANSIAYEVDRYLAVPGQATSYMLGSLEIERLRAMAEERRGDAFDIRAFHDLVLEDGGITLSMLRAKVEAWVEAGLEG